MSRVASHVLAYPRLRQRVMAEAMGRPHWGAADMADRTVVFDHQSVAVEVGGHHIESPAPMWPEQQIVAQDIARALNRLLHHDGFWIVMWYREAPLPAIIGPAGVEYEAMRILFGDRDGDIQFVVENDLGVAEIARNGIDSIIENCARAYAVASEALGAMEVRPEQMIRHAAGQDPTGG